MSSPTSVPRTILSNPAHMVSIGKGFHNKTVSRKFTSMQQIVEKKRKEKLVWPPSPWCGWTPPSSFPTVFLFNNPRKIRHRTILFLYFGFSQLQHIFILVLVLIPAIWMSTPVLFLIHRRISVPPTTSGSFSFPWLFSGPYYFSHTHPEVQRDCGS